MEFSKVLMMTKDSTRCMTLLKIMLKVWLDPLRIKYGIVARKKTQEGQVIEEGGTVPKKG